RDPDTGDLGPMQLGAMGVYSAGIETIATIPNSDGAYVTNGCGDIVSMQHVRVTCSAEPDAGCIRGTSGKGQVKAHMRLGFGQTSPLAWTWRSDANALMPLLADAPSSTDVVVCFYPAEHTYTTSNPSYFAPAGGFCNGRPCWKGSVYAGKISYQD